MKIKHSIAIIILAVLGLSLPVQTFAEPDSSGALKLTIISTGSSPYQVIKPGLFHEAMYAGASYASVDGAKGTINIEACLLTRGGLTREDVILEPKPFTYIVTNSDGNLYYSEEGCYGGSIMGNGLLISHQTQGEGSKELTVKIFGSWTLGDKPTSEKPILLGTYKFEIQK